MTDYGTFPFKRLSPTAKAPVRAHTRDAGLDLFADLGAEGRVLVIGPGQWDEVPTGIALASPPGTAPILKEKSGLAKMQGVRIMAGVGDESYRGEFRVLVRNVSAKPLAVKHGMKICQMLLVFVSYAQPVEVDELDDTDRGAAGFGSTGEF